MASDTGGLQVFLIESARRINRDRNLVVDHPGDVTEALLLNLADRVALDVDGPEFTP